MAILFVHDVSEVEISGSELFLMRSLRYKESRKSMLQ